MKLADVFKKLSFSYLSELSISGEGSGQIVEEHRPKIIQRINEALLTLYTRFPLRVKTLTLETFSTVNEYYLRPEYAVTSDSVEAIRYIIDTEQMPFANDILMIENIVDVDGFSVPFGDAESECSWRLPQYDTIVIDAPIDATRFRIYYRAMPEEVPFGPLNPNNVEIRLPRILENALLAHVAGNVYGNMSMEGALAKSQNFLDTYENECKILEERNVLNTSIAHTNIKPKLNGWP